MSDECPLCGSTLNTKQTVRKDALAAENAKLRKALEDLLSLVEEHGSATIRAHATKLMEIRKALKNE